jgi:hypothetical protein
MKPAAQLDALNFGAEWAPVQRFRLPAGAVCSGIVTSPNSFGKPRETLRSPYCLSDDSMNRRL